MKNIVKKIAVAFLSMIVVAGVFAPVARTFAATFNTVSGDFPTLQISNYTQHPESNQHWATSVSANAGEIVSFVVYYYNTASDTANGTRVHVQLPTGSFTSNTISGDVQANNASTVSGNVSVTLSSNQSLTFIPGSVKWYQNQSVTASALPNGQNGSEIISNGLSLGDIAPQGWGTVVFRAQVSSSNTINNPPQQNGSSPVVSTNSASSIYQDRATVNGTVNPNNSATTAWFEYGTTQSFGNTTSYQTVGSGSGNQAISGYLYNLLPNTTYYYRAVAQNSYGTNYGSTLTFTTQSYGLGLNGSAPTVVTNSTISSSQNYATLQGSINPNGSPTNAWFEYGMTQSLGNTSGYQSVGSGAGQTTIYGYLSNLSPNVTYYYRAVAQNSYGTSYGTIMTFTTQSGYYGNNNGNVPLVYTNAASTFNANTVTFNGSVNPNNSNTNAWFEYGLTQSLGYTVGYQSVGSGSYTSTVVSNISNLAPNTVYYYRTVAQNSYGTAYGTIMSFTTNNGNGYNVSGNAPYVTTRAANAVFQNSALINGNVNPNGSLANAWFEYGTTASLGDHTVIQPVGQANYVDNYAAVLSGLRAGTTYYYRAVAQNAYGTTYGSILNFTTAATQVTPVIVSNTTQPQIIVQQISGSSVSIPALLLTPSIDIVNPKAGDTVEYSVQYRNTTNKNLTAAKLRIQLPNETQYVSATLLPSNTDDHLLTFDLGTINANSQGVITIKVKIAKDIENGSALMFSATMDYTDAKKQFQSVSAYLTVIAEGGTAGLASLISVLGDLFNNWFIDLLLGLLIGFGIYHFFVRQKEEEVLVK